MFNACIVIPVYDHERSVPVVLDGIAPYGLQCILIDDGSSEACRSVLNELAADRPDRVRLIRHERNRGKGEAVMTGIRAAAAHGYTHVLQIDADGQHQTHDIPVFMAEAQRSPSAVVVGAPVFDRSVPRVRKFARYLTHVWVWINTCSLDIRDSMCGFRVYPVAPVLELMQSVKLGSRMEFDIEILVRLRRLGTRIVNIPTGVTYPYDGVSHFRMWRDNLRISRMHGRLFISMLGGLPARFLRWMARS